MIRFLITTLVLFFFNIGCRNRSDYIKVYTLASPKGDKCLTFIVEYDGDNILKNNSIYLLGYNPNQQEVKKLPDANYLALGDYGMEGIDVTWRQDKVFVYYMFKPLVNKLDSNSFIVFKGELPAAGIEDFHSDRITHGSYSFQKIQMGKYKSCQ